MKNGKKTIEETYKKMEPIEHILRRPDSYIGSTEPTDQELWILSEDDKRFEYKEMQVIPGLYKIFDEILVNAADNF